MDKRTWKVALVGAGPIGLEIARLILDKPSLELVVAVDTDEAKIGRDLGELLGLDEKVGVVVRPDLDVAVDAVCHSTTSRLETAGPHIIELLERGHRIITTTEEMAFPLDPDFRERLQRAAHQAAVSVLGTGVNPGFVMDKLALTLSAVCQKVDSVSIRRTVDASLRREPLQRKVGAGMTREEFEKAVGQGTIRHMGMRESLHLLASGLNLEIESETSELIEPVIAEREVKTPFLTVAPGLVAGVHQTIAAETKQGTSLALELFMYVGADNPADRIEIRGVPDVIAEIEGGVHGDRATAAMVVNAIPRVIDAKPGLLTMDDIAISYH